MKTLDKMMSAIDSSDRKHLTDREVERLLDARGKSAACSGSLFVRPNRNVRGPSSTVRYPIATLR